MRKTHRRYRVMLEVTSIMTGTARAVLPVYRTPGRRRHRVRGLILNHGGERDG